MTPDAARVNVSHPMERKGPEVSGSELRAEFVRLTCERTAAWIRPALLISVVATVLASVYDAGEGPAWAEQRIHLLVNMSIAMTLVGCYAVLKRARMYPYVFHVIFTLCTLVVVLDAFVLGGWALAPSRLAFLFLLVFGLTLLTVEWGWRWQAALASVALVCFMTALPPTTKDYAFFSLALSGAGAVTTALAALLWRRRYSQFCTELQLRRANRIKGDFLGMMSHELRSPLNVIIGYTEMLADGELGTLNAAQVDTMGRVRTAATQLLTLVENTLSAASLESGRVLIHAQAVTLHALIDELRRDSALLPGAHVGVAVIFEEPPNGVHIETDVLKLKEIALNLVGNAIKYTASGEVRVSTRIDSGCLRLAVRDTGAGIPLERIPIIFESFEQLGNAAAPGGGVGLGLYIVRQLVDALGGSIHVDSAVGQGSTFQVTLPVRVLEAAG